MKVLVTGGAGFIGFAVVRLLLEEIGVQVVNVDKMTYAANPAAVSALAGHAGYAFEKADICDAAAMAAILARHQPDAIMHLAAESHVDRSIDGPAEFITTNIFGTYTLLEASLAYWRGLPAERRERFRFHHISTDEVYGSLGAEGLFTETTPYAPNSPYSASKASSDHLVRAWHHTFKLPVVTSNCSNNYGPYQFPEKLIPLITLKALAGEKLPVYGTGENVRDWLYVEDHARALWLILTEGRVGESYNVGGYNEKTNIEVVRAICDLVDEMAPNPAIGRRQDLISFVGDRPGHDLRYAIDAAKIAGELGWKPREDFASGLRKTVRWYLDNQDWAQSVQQSGTYTGQRLGVKAPA